MESKKELIDSILETVRVELETFVDEEPSIENPVEYENRLIDIGRHLSRVTLKKSMGKLPRSRNSKKSPDESRPD